MVDRLPFLHQQQTPGPKGLPGVGCLPYLANDALGFWTQTVHRYSPISRYFSIGVVHYLPSHPDYIAAIYQQDTKNYTKGYLHQMIHPVTGPGVALSNGELWQHQRELLQPLFSAKAVWHWYEPIYRETQQFISRWMAQSDIETDIVESFYQLILRIFVPMLFGPDIRYDAAGKIVTTLATLADCLFHQIIRAPLLNGLLNRLPLPDNRRLEQNKVALHNIINELIETGKVSYQHPDNHSVLAHLLRSRETSSQPQLTDRQIASELITLFIAGVDTTALTLAWTLYFLSRHPQVDAHVAEEASNIDWSTFTKEDVDRLPFTQQVIQETLRLMPPAYIVARYAKAHQQLLDTPIENNAVIMLCQYAMHRHPTYWQAPEQFDPARFSKDRLRSIDHHVYFPFGRGPRMCLGLQLAQLETVAVLGMICAKLRPQLNPYYRLQLYPHLSLQPKGGLPMRLIRR